MTSKLSYQSCSDLLPSAGQIVRVSRAGEGNGSPQLGISHVAAEDAQVGGGRVAERREVAADGGRAAVVAGELQGGGDDHERAAPADSLQRVTRVVCVVADELQLGHEVGTEDSPVRTAVEQKALDAEQPV